MDKRFSILETLFKDNKKVTISYEEIELSKKEKRMIPTYEFLQYLYKKYPDYKFYYTIGGDNVTNLKTWDDGEQLFNEANYIVFARKGYNFPNEELPPKRLFNET